MLGASFPFRKRRRSQILADPGRRSISQAMVDSNMSGFESASVLAMAISSGRYFRIGEDFLSAEKARVFLIEN